MKKPFCLPFLVLMLLFVNISYTTVADTNKTLYVDDDGITDYNSIQEAIDAAEKGDTVFVNNGMYNENIEINKPIHLVGEDVNQVIIDGYGESAITISDSDVTVTGFTLKNGKPGTYADGINLSKNSRNTLIDNNKFIEWRNANGIFIDANCEQSRISNNEFINCHHGIEITSDQVHIKNNVLNTTEHWEWSIRVGQNVDYVVIEQNTIYGDGITLSYSNGSMIKENTFINQHNPRGEYYSACGLHLWSCENTTVMSNDFYHNGIFIHGDTIESWTTHSIDENQANNQPIYYFKNQVGSQFSSNLNAAQLILANCSDCVIENLELHNVSVALQLGFSSDNILSENRITHAGSSMYLEHSDDNLIEYNQIQQSSDKGVWLRASDNNQIIGNTIATSETGIFQQVHSSNCEINHNIIKENGEGINCVSSWSATIEKNTIQKNEKGVFLMSCYEFRIQQNNFLENTVHAEDSTENNHWDNNYWDDWIGFKIPFLVFIPYMVKGMFLTNFDWHPASEPFEIGGE